MKTSESIFVVDDALAVAEDIAERLVIEGIQDVRVFGDGRDALKAMEKVKPKAVISDVVMPGMNGIEFCAKVKSLSPKTIIQIYSGNSREDILRVYGKMDADVFTQKPLKDSFYKAFLKYLGFRMVTPGVLDSFTSEAKARWGYDPKKESAVRLELYLAALEHVSEPKALGEMFWYRQANFLDAFLSSNPHLPAFDEVVIKLPPAVMKLLKLQTAKIPRLDPTKLNEFLMLNIVNPILFGDKSLRSDFETWKRDVAELYCQCRIRMKSKGLKYYVAPMREAQIAQMRKAAAACEELRFFGRRVMSVTIGNEVLVIPGDQFEQIIDRYRATGADPEQSSSCEFDEDWALPTAS